MGYLTSAIKLFRHAIGFLGGWEVRSLAGNLTLTLKDGQFQRIDPNGARDVILPTVTSSEEGYPCVIANAANGAEDITVKDDAGATIGTVSQNELGIFQVDSSGAWLLYFILTGSPS